MTIVICRAGRRLVALGLVCSALGVLACASIPPESVALSRSVGAGIGSSRSAHLATLDAFYKRLKSDNDAWMLGTFFPRLIANTKAGFVATCRANGDTSPDCSRISEDDLVKLTSKVIAFRDSIQAALEKSRDDAFRIIDDHYADLSAANAAVTGLLASAVDVKDATREASVTLGEITSIEIDADAIEKAVTGFLGRTGEAGAQVSELEAQLAAILARFRTNDNPER